MASIPKAPRFKGRLPSTEQASKAARGSSRKRGTQCETALELALRRIRLRPSRNSESIPGKPDFVFPRLKVAVFCDGDFWHGRNWNHRRKLLEKGSNASYWVSKIAANRARDRRVTKQLQLQGFTVVRLWESDIKRDPAAAAAYVAQHLTKAREWRKHGVIMKSPTAHQLSRSVISLFSGAGGLDLGFEAAGFETRVAVELDRDAVETLRANRKWPVLDRDIHTIGSEELLATAGLRIGEADILIGGPPCQPFSKAGYWSTGDSLRLDDARAGTIGAYLRVLRDTLPKAFLLENVPGLAFKGKSEGLELVRRTIEEINRARCVNYSIQVAQLNAADYGVPQTRERVFVVGSRDGHRFEFPDPTHFDPEKGFPLLGGAPYLTAWDAIGDLEEVASEDLGARGKWADLLPTIPEGENYLWHTERGHGLPLFGWRRRFWTFLLKLAKNRPSWTLQAQPGPAVGPFHWKNRRLSPRELCRLQTFPEGYRISGNLTSVQRQLGNAVPSGLAEVLARAIRTQLLADTLSQEATLLPQPNRPIPAPEPVSRVPARYRSLVGVHDAHPGTGKGFGASRRRSVDAPVAPAQTAIG